ncbi:metal-dependent hydrolase [Actomonas aquatica]|uniref:UPF0173 metal-dependent hydrolase K1X11_008705 n=1 Tax=Actomonas aquatica TaxID=2866162 RepID=A0ABZ1CCT4_9BACT|nr:metal-dependent hydrolase [Opitutus sp. WL0086]WRQ89488.1 metal-dependent hydrolase [Opitutus sp. WL0086]
MKVTYYGHSAFLVETAHHRILIDPFLSGNPSAPISVDEAKCDYILLTHAHSDHSADAEAIATANNATIVANFEIAEYYAAKGLTTHGMNPGGGFNFPFGRVTLTIAFHTSSFDSESPAIYGGVPCGIVIEADGQRLYHAGDTALFSDMQLIGRRGLDLALVPIGDNFTMGPTDALDALDYLKPKLAVPIHYNTWPPIAQDADAWARAAGDRGRPVKVMQPGDTLEL